MRRGSSTARPIFRVRTRAISCRVRTLEFAPRRERPMWIIDLYYCGSNINFNPRTVRAGCALKYKNTIYFSVEYLYGKLSRKYLSKYKFIFICNCLKWENVDYLINGGLLFFINGEYGWRYLWQYREMGYRREMALVVMPLLAFLRT